jgi:hypothetical protein
MRFELSQIGPLTAGNRGGNHIVDIIVVLVRVVCAAGERDISCLKSLHHPSLQAPHTRPIPNHRQVQLQPTPLRYSHAHYARAATNPALPSTLSSKTHSDASRRGLRSYQRLFHVVVVVVLLLRVCCGGRGQNGHQRRSAQVYTIRAYSTPYTANPQPTAATATAHPAATHPRPLRRAATISPFLPHQSLTFRADANGRGLRR